MVMRIKNLLYVLLFVLVSSTFVYAADLMSFTANVKDGSGNNFGAGDVVVEIYDAASGGNLIYNSTNDFLKNVSNGQVDVMLGSGTQLLNLVYGKDYYMEVYLNRTDLDFQGRERQQFQAGIGNVTSARISNVTAESVLSGTFKGNSYTLTGGLILQSSLNATHVLPSSNASYNLGEQDSRWWNNIFGVTGYFLSKVGIGTTNPSSALNVTGNVGVTGTVTANAFVGSGTGLTGVSSMVYTNLALTNQSNVFSGNITITENLTVDGGTLYVDSVNNRVGILTVSPSSALNVTGDVGVTGTVTATSFVGSGAGLTGISGMSYTNLALRNESNVMQGNLTLKESNFTINGSVFYVEGKTGRVGIGTTSPQGLLNIEATSGNLFNISNGTANLVLVDIKGYVGIGTTSPGTILNISASTNQKIYIKKGYIYDNGNALVLGHD